MCVTCTNLINNNNGGGSGINVHEHRFILSIQTTRYILETTSKYPNHDVFLAILP